MKLKSPLRCTAVQARDGAWWATCIDLDISVQGQSFPEVRDGLHEAIDMYLERAAELPEAEQRALLARRAPWHVRAKYHLGQFLSRFRKDDSGHRHFELPAHA